MTHIGPIGTRRKPSKKQFTHHLSIYLPAELIERLDAWRSQQYAPPARIALIRQILTDFLNHQEVNRDRRHDP